MTRKKSIFKFTSFETALSIIEGQSLFFSGPNSFNDPLDCVIDRLTFDIKDIGSEAEKDLKDLENRFGPTMDRFTPERLEILFKKSVQNKLDRTSVCCFSNNKNNPLMWAHYGEKHTGICLEFEFDDQSPFEEIQSDQLTWGDINYNEPEPFNYLKDKKEGIWILYKNKSRHWDYEEEFRILFLGNPGIYKFKKHFLKGICFGLRNGENSIDLFKSRSLDYQYENLKFSRMERKGLTLKEKKIT